MRLHVSILKRVYIVCIYIPIIGSLFVRISFFYDCIVFLYNIFGIIFFHLLSTSKKKATKRENDDEVSYLSY